MDKTLKRKIGYVAGTATEKIEPKKAKENPQENKELNIEKPKDILGEGVKMAKWLISFSILNKSALCKEANIDRGNFDKYLIKGEIPKQHIEPIKKVIKEYGYE